VHEIEGPIKAVAWGLAILWAMAFAASFLALTGVIE